MAWMFMVSFLISAGRRHSELSEESDPAEYRSGHPA
jgi:hypothetical protein